ncbi:helix-turn-helix domain-containing protein [Allonocardiopsis opalescens]|uniref:Transcriptional regulator with XRE-family HTH domain n=1 Tax=Allonocardiopsis opalescens TaxID=1144618 RepID=A0A2T0PXR1_9ACTN|nr:helix-turn-helix transcriptional regulator [Allonocardiopsis opalescens]PRX96324.1 transcriptional regulator with XRE-family HTH domain [Allonocardiopsis opalescens]
MARARKRRGLTQQGLAQRTRYSRSHIAQVEAGHKAATPAFIAAVSDALKADMGELYGQPYRGDTPSTDRVHRSIPDLRRALAWSDLPPELEGPPRSLGTLAAEVEEAKRLRRLAQHVRLGTLLPAVMEELSFHAHDTNAQRAWRLLSDASCAAGELSRRLGYSDLADSMFREAARFAVLARDPHLPLIITWRRSLVLINHGALAAAVRLLDRCTTMIEEGRPGDVEVSGALHLRAAVIAGRLGDSGSAWDHFERAAEISARAGRPHLDEYSTYFSPGNILIHGAAVATELGDYDEAVRRDAAIPPHVLNSLVRERRSHHLIDMSRVHAEQGRNGPALARLLEAERIAPQMTRYHPSARTVATHLQDRQRVYSEGLRGLVARMHL